MATPGWSEPYKCSNFINGIVHRQQLPLATSIISQYIEINNLQQTPFAHIENDIQYNNDSHIKQYIIKQIPNSKTVKSIFIDICALIEAAPITNVQFNMVSIQFTRITFDEFKFKHRRKCMRYIIINCNFDDGIHGLYADLLEYDKDENMSDVIDHLSDNSNDGTAICHDTAQVEQWLYFLKKSICEYAYHPPIDAIVFIKELKIEFRRYNIYEFDEDLSILETYLCGDEDKEEEPNMHNKNNMCLFANTFEWLKQDIYNAVGNDIVVESKEDNIVKVSEIKQIINDEEFIEQLLHYSSEICYIQNSDFRRLFVESQDNLNAFRLKHRTKCAQYIVTKYLSPQHARNDKNTLKRDLMDINMNDCILNLIFDEELNLDNVASGDEKQNKLFTRNEECEQFINALFPLKTIRNEPKLSSREYEQHWTEKECEKLLNKCIEIKGTMAGDWFQNSVIMHSKLQPNRAFNLSEIDIRYAAEQRVNNPSKQMDKHVLSERFQQFIKTNHSEITLDEKLSMHGLSDCVTNRYLAYIPVIVTLLTNKLNGNCYMTQSAMVEISFRISDIMIAYRQKDPDKIIHCDLNIFYNIELWQQMKEKLKQNNPKNIFKFNVNPNTEQFYPSLFEKITHKIVGFDGAKKCVIRIFMLLNSKTLKIRVEFAALNDEKNTSDIDKKINDRKDPIYLPHVLYAWQRYENLLIANDKFRKCSFMQKCKNMKNKIRNKGMKEDKNKPKIETNDSNDSSDDSDDVKYDEPARKCIECVEHFQYSLIIFPNILSDESRTYTTKQFLCIGNGILPFKRSDIVNLMPRMFDKKNTPLTMDFIQNMEREYGNTSHRKDFFYDKKYDEMQQMFDAIKLNKTKGSK